MENEIKDIFCKIPGLLLTRIYTEDIYVVVRVLYSGGKISTPLFWNVREIDFEAKEVIYEMKQVDLEYYTHNNKKS